MTHEEILDYFIEPLTVEQSTLLGSFDCGNLDISEYLNNKAINDVDAMTYIFKTKMNEVLGFVTLCCTGLTVSDVKCFRQTFPAIEIKYFAVSKTYQKYSLSEADEDEDEEHPFYLSDQLLMDVVYMCRVLSENVIGAGYILLYAVEYAESFYARNLFEPFTQLFKKDRTRFLEGCIPMYMKL